VPLVVNTATGGPPRLTNTGQTLQQICSQGLAPIVGGLLGGFVYEHIGARQLFLGSAAGIVAGIAIVWASTATLAAPASE
jgi:predicted MFS family arabinose efflux permease